MECSVTTLLNMLITILTTTMTTHTNVLMARIQRSIPLVVDLGFRLKPAALQVKKNNITIIL
jgi:hypothetical protein